MSTTFAGIVKDGVIVPDVPLPEGAHFNGELLEIPLELQLELTAWRRASTNSLALVEQLAQ